MSNRSATRTGVAHLPLHRGKTPRWLFERMTRLSREIVLAIVAEHGPEEVLRRISDPFWFQALGCVLGFDWHSSGVTTTVCGALKEGIRGVEGELGLFIAGGKGRTSRQTPSQIEEAGPLLGADPSRLVYASRMAAKVDTSGLQDGYQLYHHTFLFTAQGQWAVVQQGMNETTRYARRYHWLGEAVADFVCEPHSAICSQARGEALNLVAVESSPARDTIAQIASQEKPEKLGLELKRLKSLELPRRGHILLADIHPERVQQVLLAVHGCQPRDFEGLLGLPGVGPKTIRALSLISELVYGVPPSFQDPARYSFAHGGKDGHPYPVDRATYDRSIEVLATALRQAKLGNAEKLEALKRLRGAGFWEG
ncbi:MAG TPA: DUF763 domain-containing protein [Dehalococcoidia bacterium]|nr:DUF763 domain-containing protein [Dehalococcoidia bacterium]